MSKQDLRRLHNMIKNTVHKEIFNFSSSTWTDIKNPPNLNLNATYDISDGTSAVISNYTGLNSHTYQVTLSNGDIRYITEVSGEDHQATYHNTDGGASVLNIHFISPRTLIFSSANSNIINLNQYHRLFIDENIYKIQRYDGANWVDRWALN